MNFYAPKSTMSEPQPQQPHAHTDTNLSINQPLQAQHISEVFTPFLNSLEGKLLRAVSKGMHELSNTETYNNIRTEEEQTNGHTAEGAVIDTHTQPTMCYTTERRDVNSLRSERHNVNSSFGTEASTNFTEVSDVIKLAKHFPHFYGKPAEDVHLWVEQVNAILDTTLGENDLHRFLLFTLKETAAKAFLNYIAMKRIDKHI